jgi:hypothetical protein
MNINASAKFGLTPSAKKEKYKHYSINSFEVF